MKNALLFLSLLITTQAFAAKFTPIRKLQALELRTLAVVGLSITKNESSFGDAGKVESFTFTREASEKNEGTIKQLNYKRGATSDDGFSDFQKVSVEKIADYAFASFEIQDEDQENDVKKEKARLIDVLTTIKANKNFKVYGTNHADEDGSWQVIYVLDTRNSEIIRVQIGYSGT